MAERGHPFDVQKFLSCFGPICLLLLLFLCFWGHIQEIIAKHNVMKLFAVFFLGVL